MPNVGEGLVFRKPATGIFSESNDKTFLGRVSQGTKKSLLDTDLPLQFITLYLRLNFDFQARRCDEYLFGVLTCACKRRTHKALVPS